MTTVVDPVVAGTPTGGGGGGDATAANQVAGNLSLSNLDTDLGAQADAVATTDTGSFSVIAFIKRGMQNWTSLLARIPSALTAGGNLKTAVSEALPAGSAVIGRVGRQQHHDCNHEGEKPFTGKRSFGT